MESNHLLYLYQRYVQPIKLLGQYKAAAVSDQTSLTALDTFALRVLLVKQYIYHCRKTSQLAPYGFSHGHHAALSC